MTMRRLLFLVRASLVTALAPGLTALAAAQVPASIAEPTLAAPSAVPVPVPAPPARTGPRLLSPTETRNSATPPGDLRPERPVTPQIRIPFGKAPPPALPAPAPARSPTAGPSANAALPASTAPLDATEAARNAGAAAAARCETLVGEQVRAKCRDRVARDARGR